MERYATLCSSVRLANVPKYNWLDIFAVALFKETLASVFPYSFSELVKKGCNYELLAKNFQFLSQTRGQLDTEQRLL